MLVSMSQVQGKGVFLTGMHACLIVVIQTEQESGVACHKSSSFGCKAGPMEKSQAGLSRMLGSKA